MPWVHLDSNQGPAGYEPDALTAELWTQQKAPDYRPTGAQYSTGKAAENPLSQVRIQALITARKEHDAADVGLRFFEPEIFEKSVVLEVWPGFTDPLLDPVWPGVVACPRQLYATVEHVQNLAEVAAAELALEGRFVEPLA